MIRQKFGYLISLLGVGAFLMLPITAFAAHSTLVKWHVVGVISGEATPATSAMYFPRPLAAGELVDMVHY